MEGGWVKLHRKAINSKYGKNMEMLGFWSYLLLIVNHNGTYSTPSGVILRPGQVATGRKRICKETGLSESKVERFLKKLEIEHQIEQQKTNKYRIITITNWSEYQKSDSTSDNNRTTTGQQPNNKRTLNKKKRREDDKENKYGQINGFDFDTLYQAFPRKKGKQNGASIFKRTITTQGDYDNLLKAVKNYNAECNKNDIEERWIKHFSTFMNCWEDYVESGTDVATNKLNEIFKGEKDG